MNLKEKLILFILICLGLVLRLYKINTPLADWHSWRQADTAAVTRRFVNEGIDLLHPKYDDVSNIPSGLDNPQGYRMVEFPLVNGLTAGIYRLIPSLNKLAIHVFSRLVSILFSLGSLVFIFLLVKNFSTTFEATLAAFIFAVLPYNVFYSRTVLPEIPLVFFTLAELYFISRYFLSDKYSLTNIHYWLAAIAGALALLVKPYAIFLTLPMFYLAIKKQGSKLFTDYRLYLYSIIILIPLILWRLWIQQFPEGIPAFWWLLNGNAIRFKGAFFRWLFAERLAKLILGFWGLVLLAFGLIKKTNTKEGWFYHWWLVAILVYFTVFATGNVQHDYYQIISIPIISIFVAKGIVSLINNRQLTSYFLLLTSIPFMLAFSWFEIRGFYNINNPAMVEAGQAVNELTEPDALVIAPYQGDTAFLYQTNRRGWPIGTKIEDKIQQGADYYVSLVHDEETQELIDHYGIFHQTSSYTLIKLTDE